MLLAGSSLYNLTWGRKWSLLNTKLSSQHCSGAGHLDGFNSKGLADKPWC